MPDNVKKEIISLLESIPLENTDGYMHTHHIPGIINFIKNGKPDLKLWDKFILETKTHDKYRNQDFAKVFPNYADLIGYHA
jgi:hypothetical protein